MEEGTKTIPPMTDPPASTATAGIRPGWHTPQPETLPRPTYWPAVMALGIVFLLWGVVTTFIISGAGLVLFALALAGWIGEIRYEG